MQQKTAVPRKALLLFCDSSGCPPYRSTALEDVTPGRKQLTPLLRWRRETVELLEPVIDGNQRGLSGGLVIRSRQPQHQKTLPVR